MVAASSARVVRDSGRSGADRRSAGAVGRLGTSSRSAAGRRHPQAPRQKTDGHPSRGFHPIGGAAPCGQCWVGLITASLALAWHFPLACSWVGRFGGISQFHGGKVCTVAWCTFSSWQVPSGEACWWGYCFQLVLCAYTCCVWVDYDVCHFPCTGFTDWRSLGDELVA